MGRERARHGLQQAVEHRCPQRILAVGLSGGLHPNARTGESGEPAWVVGENPGDRPIPLNPWPGHRPRGGLVTVHQLAANPAAKAQLRDRFQADWVDMETYAWAQVARQGNIPLTVIRVVVDGPASWMPTWRRITSWPAAVGLPWRSWVAQRVLTRQVRDALCGFS
nr:hypothetical protein [Sulfobacillus harzensis]